MKKLSEKQRQFNNRKSKKRLALKVKRAEHNKQLRLAQERLEKYYRRTRGREETLVL
tara:strand:+ start:338 stop:508 length:171 start_codon:yes stop_codon:yes gene_type:complete